MEENLTSQELIEKREREKTMVSDMIRVYCKGNHAAYDKKNKCLCKECQALDDYARMRSDKCPFIFTLVGHTIFYPVRILIPFAE